MRRGIALAPQGGNHIALFFKALVHAKLIPPAVKTRYR
jgi:hypothetical protein